MRKISRHEAITIIKSAVPERNTDTVKKVDNIHMYEISRHETIRIFLQILKQ